VSLDCFVKKEEEEKKKKKKKKEKKKKKKKRKKKEKRQSNTKQPFQISNDRQRDACGTIVRDWFAQRKTHTIATHGHSFNATTSSLHRTRSARASALIRSV
jgi:outer membrane biosynthesis protein TonB